MCKKKFSAGNRRIAQVHTLRKERSFRRRPQINEWKNWQSHEDRSTPTFYRKTLTTAAILQGNSSNYRTACGHLPKKQFYSHNLAVIKIPANLLVTSYALTMMHNYNLQIKLAKTLSSLTKTSLNCNSKNQLQSHHQLYELHCRHARRMQREQKEYGAMKMLRKYFFGEIVCGLIMSNREHTQHKAL